MKDPLDDIALLHNELYRVAKQLAKKLSGDQVVEALESASRKLYEAGADEALRKAESRIQKWDHIADAWDFVWLSAWILELKKASE